MSGVSRVATYGDRPHPCVRSKVQPNIPRGSLRAVAQIDDLTLWAPPHRTPLPGICCCCCGWFSRDTGHIPAYGGQGSASATSHAPARGRTAPAAGAPVPTAGASRVVVDAPERTQGGCLRLDLRVGADSLFVLLRGLRDPDVRPPARALGEGVGLDPVEGRPGNEGPGFRDAAEANVVVPTVVQGAGGAAEELLNLRASWRG